jgi:zinc transporter ZupT
MAKMGMAGVSEPAGSGEALERSRRRRKYAILALIFLLAFPAGFVVGFTEADDLLIMEDRWPPALALGLSFAYLGLVLGGALALSRQVDEVERMTKYKAVTVAAGAYLTVYPVWFLWWKGGFASEPMHVALYAGFLIVFALASLFYRFR